VDILCFWRRGRYATPLACSLLTTRPNKALQLTAR
jgi:hypothetical protein